MFSFLHVTFAAAFTVILGTFKEGDKLEMDQKFQRGDNAYYKVCSPAGLK